MSDRLLAVVNPAAGGGRCGRLAAAALEELRRAGVDLEVAESRAPGDATRLTREHYAQGWRRFLAVGGDGTSFEIVNGLFPEAAGAGRPLLGFLPLGTGNSFLRDFSECGAEHAAKAIVSGRTRPCDVLRLTHAPDPPDQPGGTLYYINLATMGFATAVTATTNRHFKWLGELGYVLGVLRCLAPLKRHAYPVRLDDDAEFDRRRCLFLTFSNSKFTGGKMMIAPKAETGDGLIECMRWGPIGRIGLLRNLPGLFDGTHLEHPLAERRAARRVEFDLDAPVEVMVDGEVLLLRSRTIDVLQGAMDVMV